MHPQAAIGATAPTPQRGADNAEVEVLVADPGYEQRARDIDTLVRLAGKRSRGEMTDKLAELEKAQAVAVSPKMASASEAAKRRREAPDEAPAPPEVCARGPPAGHA